MIRNIFRTLLVLCITFGYWTTTDAATVNWSAFRFVTEDSEKVGEINKGSYDFAREELTLNFKLTTTRDPREDYILETEVGGKDCEMLLEYDSPYIIGECVLDINEADAKGMYEIDFEIIDEDDNTVYARNSYDIEIEGLEDDFDWDELQYEALYVMEDQDLLITLFLEDVVREPNHEYRVYIDLEGKEYNKNLSYSSSDEKLYVEFEIYINEDDIEDEYDLDYEIIDRDEDDEEVADADFDIQVEIEDNEDNFDWDELEYTGVYDLESGDLELEFYFEDVEDEPYGDYSVYVEVDGEEDDTRFRYDEDEERLYAEISMDLDEDDRYNVEFYVEDRDTNKKILEDDFNVSVNTEDDIDWDELDITLAYDADEEDLYVTFTVDIDSEPRFDYDLDFELDRDDYDGRFEYQESKDRLYKQFVISIDEDDIEDEYEVDYEVNNNDTDEEEADEVVDIDVEVYEVESDDIDWDELDITLAYDEDEEILYVTFIQEVSSAPLLDYEVDFELDNEEYDGEFKYDDDELIVSFEIEIDADDIEDEYELDYQIYDEDSEEVADESIDIDVDEYEEENEDENTEEDDDVAFNDDWEGIDVSLEYSGPNRKMKVLFELESYRFNPKKEYSLELHLDDNTKVEGELTYSSVLGKMYGTFSTYIATNKVVDIYEAKLYIRDEDDKRIHFQEDDYKVRFIDFVYNPKKEKAEDLSESQKAGIEKAITKYADKIIKKYRIKKSAMKHLEIIVTLFEAYAIEKPKYAKIVEEANKVLREIIQENS